METRIEVEELQAEVRDLRERVAFLEGRRRGTLSTLEIVLPVGIGILALLGFTALTARVNNLVDQRVEAIVTREVEAVLSPEMVQAQLDSAIQDTIVRVEQVANEAEQAVLEAEQAVLEAEAAAGDAEDAVVQVEDTAEQVEETADTVEAVATETANGTR